MKADRTLQSLHETWLRERPCPALDVPVEGSQKLTVTDMAGIFFVWSSGIAVSGGFHFLVVYARRCFKQPELESTNPRAAGARRGAVFRRSTEEQLAVLEAMLIEMKQSMVRRETSDDLLTLSQSAR